MKSITTLSFEAKHSNLDMDRYLNHVTILAWQKKNRKFQPS